MHLPSAVVSKGSRGCDEVDEMAATTHPKGSLHKKLGVSRGTMVEDLGYH